MREWRCSHPSRVHRVTGEAHLLCDDARLNDAPALVFSTHTLTPTNYPTCGASEPRDWEPRLVPIRKISP